MKRSIVVGVVAALAVAVAVAVPLALRSTGSTAATQPVNECPAAGADRDVGVEYGNTGTGPMVAPTIPETPGVPTDPGTLEGCPTGQDGRRPAPEAQGCARVFRLTAEQFQQKIANFPVQTATVWGYNGSTPGPTLVSYAGEAVRIVVTNKLTVPTTLHPHGLHQPNSEDDVPAISQPEPIMPGQTRIYAFTPGHIGSFAYHSHFSSAVQELRGLDGMFTVLPRMEHQPCTSTTTTS